MREGFPSAWRAAVLVAVACSWMVQATRQPLADGGWATEFTVEKQDLSPTGRNPYFPLEPGYQLVLAGGGERLVISVLDDVKTIDGVTTRVVEERETKHGQLVEISRNYFAISTKTRDVFYYGENVDAYKDGKVVDHEGSWASGANGAKFGLFMPGAVTLKAKFYQELAPRVAMDRIEIVDLDRRVTTPAGTFDHCVVFKETSPLERLSRGYKYFARDIGLVQDGDATLVSRGPSGRAR